MINCVAEWSGVEWYKDCRAEVLCIPLTFNFGKLLEFKYVNKDLDHGHCS